MVPFRSENPSKISFERSLNTLENCVYTQKIKMKMIQRPKYLNALIRAMGNGFPKVITGIRRCGKSYLLKNVFVSYLRDQGVSDEEILSIDLDDDRNAGLRNPVSLGETVRAWAKEKDRAFVFLDEIQKVNTVRNPAYTGGEIVVLPQKEKNRDDAISFVDVVLGLSRESNIDLYVTGSNSKMLSTDVATEFRDKATTIEMAPLSFEEYAAFRGGSSYENLQDYIVYGGMPLAVLKDDEEEKKTYLKNLFETTYLKDIIERYGIEKTGTLEELANVLSASAGSLVNVQKIAATIGGKKKEKVSAPTIDRWLLALKDAFLVKEARRYDIKGRREIGALRKYYFADVGLRNARLDFAFSDEGQMLENVLYNELIYHGFSVSVGTFDYFGKDAENKTIRKDAEIDFYAKKGTRRLYIQVCADLSSPSTREREIRPFLALDDSVQKVLVLARPAKAALDENGFLVIGAPEFLLRFLREEY